MMLSHGGKFGLFVAEKRPNYEYISTATPTDKLRRRIVLDGRLTEFEWLAHQVRNDGKTLLKRERLHVLWQAILNVRDLDLAAAEVGAFRGGSAYFIAAAHNILGGAEVPVHVIDTFAGHPSELLDSAIDRFHTAEMFTDTSYEAVSSYLSVFSKVQVHRGEFNEAVKSLPKQAYGFIHIDVDTYLTTRNCLNYFFPRLSHGGVIVVDDYGARKCPGVEKAVGEFIRNQKGLQIWQLLTEQCLIVKA